MKKSIHFRYDIDLFFMALVININVIRFMLNIYTTNFILYGIYLFTIITVLLKNDIKWTQCIPRKLVYSGCALLIYLYISCIWRGSDKFILVIKYTISMIIAVLAFFLSKRKIRKLINYTLLINILYSLIILLSPSKVSQYMKGDTNYLSVTLTIGLGLSIALSGIVVSLFYKARLSNIIKWTCISGVFLLTLSRFSARGPILLPVVSVLFICLSIGIKQKKKFVFVLSLLILFGYLVLQIYAKSVSSYALSRLTRLFSDYREEDRFGIWNQSINMILNNGWWLFGSGVDGIRSEIGMYPHNYVIQLCGEAGIIGTIYCILLTILPAHNYLRATRAMKTKEEARNNASIYIVFSCFVYYFLTFSKSFSAYDAGGFMIFASMLINISRLITLPSCRHESCLD